MTHKPTQVPGTPTGLPADSNRCINAALGPSVQGIGTNVSVGAMIESKTGLPILARHDVKIIWDMTGTGPFYVFGLGPRGIRLLPLQGRWCISPRMGLAMNGARSSIFLS